MSKTDSRKFTLEFKAKVINAYLTADPKVSLSQMERMTKINRQTITAWIKKKEQILDSNSKRHRARLSPKINKCLSPLMESRLKEWILTKRSFGCCIDTATIKSKAINIFNDIHSSSLDQEHINGEFMASNGWFLNFMKRNRFR